MSGGPPLGLALNSNEVKKIATHSPTSHKGFSVVFPCGNYFHSISREICFFESQITRKIIQDIRNTGKMCYNPSKGIRAENEY